MKEKIKAYARELKIEYVGIAPAEPMRELKEYLQTRREKRGVMPFEEADIEARVNPRKTLPGAKSIIVCLFPYENGGGGAKNISRYARIPDYHRVAAAYLNQICDFIRKTEPHCTLMPFVDNGPLADKYLAYLAGLGFFGKNTLLIHETYGSFCFIGYIITDLPIEADEPNRQSCKGCKVCIKICPGAAIREGFDFCAEACVSYITQLKTVSPAQKKILSSQASVYGCDLCQNVCPHNRDIPKTPIPEFSVPTLKKLEKEDLCGLSNREFKRRFQEYPFCWRGKEAILKNFDK